MAASLPVRQHLDLRRLKLPRLLSDFLIQSSNQIWQKRTWQEPRLSGIFEARGSVFGSEAPVFLFSVCLKVLPMFSNVLDSLSDRHDFPRRSSKLLGPAYHGKRPSAVG